MPRLVVLTALLSLVLGLAQPSPTLRAQRPGVEVERVRAPVAPTVDVGDRRITIVRVDLSRYRLRILTSERHGGARTLPRWVRDHHLGGAINAGMFLPSGRSVGFMMQDGEVVSNRRVSKFRGVVGFDPRRPDLATLAVGGRGCGPSVDAMTRQYNNVLQAYRVLDCRGRAVQWPTRKRYSAAAFGVDADGRAVFVHSRTPYQMSVFSRMLAEPRLRLRGLIYMEGGPEASLVVDAEGQSVRALGSYEDGFNPNDDNRQFWEVPNVIAFEPR